MRLLNLHLKDFVCDLACKEKEGQSYFQTLTSYFSKSLSKSLLFPWKRTKKRCGMATFFYTVDEHVLENNN